MTKRKPTPEEQAPEGAPVFDISQFRAPRQYVERTIEREGEGREPIRVTLLDLDIRESKALPWGTSVPLQKSLEAAAPYVVAWNVEAENLLTGEMVPVPPPAEAGWEVFELISNLEASTIVNWLKIPHFMKGDAEKKSSTTPTSTSGRPKRKA